MVGDGSSRMVCKVAGRKSITHGGLGVFENTGRMLILRDVPCRRSREGPLCVG